MIKKFAIFFIFVVSCGQAFGQTNRLKEVCRYGEQLNRDESYTDYNWSVSVLPQDFFPWGVCFTRPSFRRLKNERWTSSQEDMWTREAMRVWNIQYKNYKINRWGDEFVIGIPDSPLFVESCDRNKYNIIYIIKRNLSGDTLGRYMEVDTFWDFINFYVIIFMDSRLPNGNYRKWTRAYFVNVMMHELGHALGLPHMKTTRSEIMPSSGFGYGCKEKKFKTKDVCKLKNYDFERFLWPYDPEDAHLPPVRRVMPKGEHCVKTMSGGWLCA